MLFIFIPGVALTKPTQRDISPIEKCLNVSTNRANDCVNKNLKVKTISRCYEMSETIFSANSKENVKNYCFYSVSEFPSLKTCTDAAKKFYMAENKDQALFECFRQFASHMDIKTCVNISKMMSYRERRMYLEKHCYNM